MRIYYGGYGAGRCAVASFGAPPFIRHALVSAPFSVALAGRPLKQASRLRFRLCTSYPRPTNQRMKGGIPESVSSRSTAEN